MTNLTGKERAQYVQGMFTRIAHHYDFMNRLMTGGQDVQWRKSVIKLAQLKPSASLLDLGAGTGDLAREALKRNPQSRIIAADFTLEMMRVGRKPGDPPYSAADALNLPFQRFNIRCGYLRLLDAQRHRCESLIEGTISRPQVRRKNRYSGYHASEEKYFVTVHLDSHARDYSVIGHVDFRNERRVSISARFHRRIFVR